MRGISLLVLGALVAGCSVAPQPVVRSAKAQDRLAKELAGLVPGEPVSCLPRYRADDMIVIDDHTVLFRDGANRVYRNNMNGGCPNLGGPYALVTRSTSGSLCRGEIGRIVDVQNNFTLGSCVFGDFIPYTRP